MDIVTMDIMIYDSTGSLQGSTGWYLMLLGQYGAILVVTCWYWVSITWYWLVLSCTGLIKGFYACIYWKKLMVTSTDQPTNRPTNRQGEYRAICLFRKLDNRKKAEICNRELLFWDFTKGVAFRQNRIKHLVTYRKQPVLQERECDGA